MAKEITEFDKLIYDDSVCMLKESLPYIDIANQKSFALIIMIMEMEHVINLYDHDTGKIKSFCKSGSVNDIISTLEKHCNDSDKKNLSSLKNILKTLKNFEKYKDILTPDVMNTIFNVMNTDTSKQSPNNNANKKNSDGSAIYDMLFNMMDNKQKELFNNYKSILF